MQNTTYGLKIKGSSQFIFVTPHGYNKDDENTAEIAEKLARLTKGYAVINRNYPRSKIDYNSINSIIRSRNTEFMNDLESFVSEVETNRKKAVVIIIHGSADSFTSKKLKRKRLYNDTIEGSKDWLEAGKQRPYDIDIGCGLTESQKFRLNEETPNEEGLKRFLPLAKTVIPERGNGLRRMSRKKAYALKKSLESLGYNTTIGREWAAQSEDNLVQVFKGRVTVDSFQLEITRKKREDVDKLSKDIASALKVVYNEAT